MKIEVQDFLYEGCDKVILEIANDGIGQVNYTVEVQTKEKVLPQWLTISAMEGFVDEQEEIVLTCDRSKLTVQEQKVSLIIRDAETAVEVEIYAKATDVTNLPKKTYLEKNGMIVMEAANFCEMTDVEKGSFALMEGYGKYGSAVKVSVSYTHLTLPTMAVV